MTSLSSVRSTAAAEDVTEDVTVLKDATEESM
jgi:hypothetical protein